MTNTEFREWLQGFFELAGEEASLNPERVQVIVNHLNLAEAVEGKLDALNGHLRSEIQAFRKAAPHEAAGFARLTESIRIQVMRP
jgi:hypothetical protein